MERYDKISQENQPSSKKIILIKMQNQQNIDYIKNQTALGISPENIKTTLIQSGQLQSDVDSAFLMLGMSAPIVQTPNSQIRQTISTVNNGAQVLYGNTEAKKGSKFIVILGIIIVLLLLSGAGVYAYMNFVSPNPQKTVNKSLTNLVTAIKKGYFDNKNSFQIKGEGLIMGSLPATLDLTSNINVKGDIEGKKTASNVSFSAKANYAGIGLTVDGSNLIDIFATKDAAYFKLNKIPTGLELFTMGNKNEIDLINREVVGKWIKIDQKQLEDLEKIGNTIKPVDLSYANNINSSSTSKLLEALGKANIFEVTETLPTEKINGKDAFHYRVKLNKEGLTSFALVAAENDKSIKESDIKSGIEEIFKALDSSGLKINIDLWVERYSKIPVKATFNFDAGAMTELKTMGINSLTVSMGTEYDFPKTIIISEPTNSIDLVELLKKPEIVNLYSASADTQSISNKTGETVFKKDSYKWIADGGADILKFYRVGKANAQKGGVVDLNNKNVTNSTISTGKKYTMYLSGISGFTEFTHAGSATKYIDISGTIAIYDSKGAVIMSKSGIYNTSGGISAETYKDLSTYLTVPATLKSGAYKWEFVVVDNRDVKNAIKGVVDFKI